MDELDVLAVISQWADIARLAVVGDERQQRDLMFAGQDTEKVVGAKPVAPVWRVGQSAGQKQNTHTPLAGAPFDEAETARR